MDLTHEFTVPTSVEETWDSFLDIGSLAECFPGAQVTSAEGDTFSGTVKVKLGPIAMVYAGSGTFVEKDEAARRLVVEAKGRDKRGNGTAGANATLTMAPDGDGTKVEIVTELAVTGKPAQFGRGVMQDVSDKLLGQFVACLEEKSAPAAAPPVEPDAPAGRAASADDSAGRAASASERVETNTVPSSATDDRVGLDTPPPSGSGGSISGGGSTSGGRADAIDLGATVGPALMKNYGKKIAIGAAIVAAVVFVRKLVRR
ncbi:carbon monoxide dehydrogenase subunit G [Nocardioides albertanoniae]|uniref:Carbon monoxide dehydrogenase subunit G n=1 Tax=Nocardioides albertanoniae TaxID=1175486 RepID=A0A543A3A3_9ACTN|nr:SRPBCC family protein [Nocardioides albertanoniae]TQL67063.1 carbon monoxide dehydrogenase subunit G [Nocardioides albertanoniae]